MFTTISKSTGRDAQTIPDRMEFLVDGEGDLPSLSAEAAAGSIAYTATLDSMWQKDNAGVWRKIGGDA